MIPLLFLIQNFYSSELNLWIKMLKHDHYSSSYTYVTHGLSEKILTLFFYVLIILVQKVILYDNDIN